MGRAPSDVLFKGENPETGRDQSLLHVCSPPGAVPCALVKHPRATLLNKQQPEKQSYITALAARWLLL